MGHRCCGSSSRSRQMRRSRACSTLMVKTSTPAAAAPVLPPFSTSQGGRRIMASSGSTRIVEAVDGGRHRICSYERRHTGRSETVDGTQSPEEIIVDVDGFLDAVGEDGPFVLLGASSGGLVAAAFAVAHPDQVTGILLLDSSIPDDYIIDQHHGFVGMCLRESSSRRPEVLGEDRQLPARQVCL